MYLHVYYIRCMYKYNVHGSIINGAQVGLNKYAVQREYIT